MTERNPILPRTKTWNPANLRRSLSRCAMDARITCCFTLKRERPPSPLVPLSAHAYPHHATLSQHMRIPTMQPQQGMSELPRGQHPHAITPFMRDNGPATWNNKLEIDRWDWDERFVPGREDGNPDGNPLAQYGMGLGPRDDVEASLEAAASRAKNWWPNVPEYNKPRTPPKAPPKPAQPSTSLWGGEEQYTPAAMKAAAGTPKTGSPSSSKMKAPSAKSPSPSTKKIFFTDQGVVTSKQRELRMDQLSSKLGVDKVRAPPWVGSRLHASRHVPMTRVMCVCVCVCVCALNGIHTGKGSIHTRTRVAGSARQQPYSDRHDRAGRPQHSSRRALANW